MKSKTNPKQTTGDITVLEIAFLALPLLALIPNFFIIPDLTYPGLATQEVVFSIASVVFAAIGLIQLVRTKTNPLRLARENALLIAALLAFILWQVISLAWSPTVWDGVRVIGIWCGFAVFFIAGVSVMRERTAELLHYVMTAVCALLVVSLIYERAVYGENMFGIFFNHGITSELLATLLPLQIINFLCTRKTGLMIVSLVVAGLGSLALLVGLRRGAILGTVVVLIVMGIGLAAKQVKLADKRRLLVIGAVLIVAATFVGVRYRQAIAFRIQGATQLRSWEGGLTTRLRGWITAWEMGKRHALIGIGHSAYPALYGDYRRYFVSNPSYAKVAEAAGGEDTLDEIRSPLVHNEYLQVFVELGIIGLLLFAAFWLQLGWRLWQGRKSSQANSHWVFGVFLGWIAFSISTAFSSFAFRYTPGAFMVACLLSIGFAFSRRSDSTTVKEASGDSARSFNLPKIAAIAIAGAGVVVCLAFTARAYNVYASQQLQGRATLRTEQLDFNFYPDRPGDNERLERRYKQVLELDPENTGAHMGYGLLLYQMKRPADAIPHIERGVKGGYNRPYGYVALAFAHEQAGNVARASEILRDCLESYPASIFARAAYTEMLRKEGKLDQVREQQALMYARDKYHSQSWELVLQTKPEAAPAEAQRRGLIPPEKLWPPLALRLVYWRAFHYLK